MFRTLTGYLREVSDGTYYMDCGDIVEYVYFRGGVATVPTNKLIALSVNDRNHVPQENNYTLVQQAQADPMPRKHIMLARFIATGSTEEQEENNQYIVEDAAEWLEHYIRYYSGDRWDVKVYGFTDRYDGYNVPPLYARAQFQKHLETNEMPEGFYPNYFHGWGGKFNREVCGLADLGGNRGATRLYGLATCGLRTIAHEMGHNFGLGHAGMLGADGTVSGYGDISSIMGSMQRYVEGHHSYHMVRMGWYEDRELKVIDTSQQILLAPIEMPYHGMHPDEYQHVLIRVAGHPDYYISIRKTKGTRYPQASNTEGHLYIHQVGSQSTTKRMGSMSVGDVKTLPNGAMVDYQQYKNETALVEVTI